MRKLFVVFKKIIPICFLLAATLSIGQQKNNKLKKNLISSDQIELERHFQILNSAINTVDSAKIYNDIASVHLKSKYYLAVPKYDSVRYYGNKSLQLTKSDKTTEGIQQYLRSLNRIGNAYKNEGYISKASENFNKILNITENISNPSNFYEARQSATTEIASFFAAQENFELAINQYTSLFEYIKDKNIDEKKISAIVFLKFGRFHRKIGRMDIALQYAYKAKEVATRNDSFIRVAMAYLELAFIKFENHETKEVDLFLAKAVDLLKNPKYIGLLAEYYYIKALIADRNTNVFEKIQNAEKAFELLNKQTVSKKHITVGNLLYEAYKENGDFQKAIAIVEDTRTLEKIISNNEELKKSAFSEITRRDTNIVFEQNKSQTKSNVILFVILLFIMAVITTIYFFKDRQKKIRLSMIIAKKNEQLKQLNEAKSQFFSNITHELQTPLTLIAGPLEQVLNENKEPLDPITKGKLQMVMNNTNALKTLINDILDLSKLKAKKLKLNAQSTNLDTFFNTTTQKFIQLTKQKDISFEYCFKDLEDFHAIVDTKKLEKIINNLLSNAIKYTQLDGAISVLGTLTKKNQLKLIVKDTGVGISAADIPQIFDRYFQTSDTTKPLEGGSGIGLSLVKELVELMNGKVTVESELGQGSTFTITMPVKKATTKLSENYSNTEFLNTDISLDHLQLETEFKVKKHTVLIVEDHTEMQEFIASILQKRYKLIIVNNGKEALEKLQTNTVDLIVSDIMMPVMDGFTLLGMIKQSETYYDIPIIMLTALAEINYKLKALTVGADDYLTKPFVSKELLARTHNLLERYITRKKIKAETIAQEDALEELLTKTDDETNVLTSIDHRKHTKTDIELIAKVAKLIEQNIDNPDFKLNDLSEKVFLGERQLRRKIKLITGLSTKKFQQEIQLLKARRLLEEDTYGNVTAVAISVGMDNVTRFSKLYVARFGKHPADYF
ncbi:response regulator [Kordia sp. YSTF-M3]|uniref:histidine kinase n=1 Tax=Kordia aestuariivivens TaxID=2759037 RepID=A0ABR7Q6U4_9FLAO|nr:ATP-binding protein [Kordia aestuariivivens]MBC8754292.1 response regulator [Kordia aestuariivivens]